MKNLILSFALFFSLTLSTFVEAALNFPSEGKVNVRNELNVRSEANAQSKIFGRLKANADVIIVDEEGDFFKLQYPQSLKTWVASYLLLNNGKSRNDQISRKEVNVRSGAGTQYAVVCKLLKGAKVDVIEVTADKWARIAPPKNTFAYVSKKYIHVGESLKKVQAKNKKIIEATRLYQSATSAFKDHLSRQKFSQSSYESLKTIFKRIQVLAPGTAMSTESVNYLVRAGDLRRLIEVKERTEQIKQDFMDKKKVLDDNYKNKKGEIDESKIEKPRKYEFEGWLNDVGGILFRPATHKLTEGSKVIVFVKSTDTSLNLDDYSGKRVGINGKVERFRRWGRVLTVSEIGVIYKNPKKFWTAE